jgi:DNA-binding transcriptional ArsR family regulator
VTSTASLRATAHPLRLRILSLLTGAELSAAEIARELATSQANASYHVRVLATAGLVVPAGEVKIRGGTAKRYRHPWRGKESDPSGARGPGDGGRALLGPAERAARQSLIRAVADELVRRSSQLREGRAYLADAELWVDLDSWQRTEELVAEASALIHDAAQPPRTEGTIRVNMSVVLFQMTESAEQAGLGR